MTGTFRGDGWGDTDNRSGKAKKKLTLDDDLDVDGLLDDLEEKKGISSKPANQNNSLWSAGGGSQRRNDHFGEDLDKLDELEEENTDVLNFKDSKGRYN